MLLLKLKRVVCLETCTQRGVTAAEARRGGPGAAQGAPDPLERHEIPDPVRSNAVEARIHCVRQAPGVCLVEVRHAFGRRSAAGRSS